MRQTRLEDLSARLVRGGRVWNDPLALVQSRDLRALAEVVGEAIGADDPSEKPSVMWPGDESEESHLPIERVSLAGLLAQQWGTLWCLRYALSPAGTPVPWDTEAFYPWAVRLHLRTPELTGDGDGLTVFSAPCRVDPRQPGREADAAIALVVIRAMLHEAQESLVLDGVRPLNPHEGVGELCLEDIAKSLGAWLPGGNEEG